MLRFIGYHRCGKRDLDPFSFLLLTCFIKRFTIGFIPCFIPCFTRRLTSCFIHCFTRRRLPSYLPPFLRKSLLQVSDIFIYGQKVYKLEYLGRLLLSLHFVITSLIYKARPLLLAKLFVQTLEVKTVKHFA
jgi:hypothetical protein